jgi:transcriptional regulator with PAS, ATPase and Fis domain
MTAPRTSAAELARALDGVSSPVYVLDSRRRIIFMNESCHQWLGDRAATAWGQECRYHTVADAAGEVPIAGLLCPPPEAFAGEAATAEITLGATPAGAADVRQAKFVPLPGDGGEQAMVLAIVAAQPAAAREAIAPDGDTPAQLHARLQQLLAARRQRFGFDRLVGESAAMRRVRAQASLVAGSLAATLIVGPAGSGRRHLAHALHEACPEARRGALVPLACSLLNAELLLASVQSLRRGRSSHGERAGTLLLEHADQLPAESQTALADLLCSSEMPPRILATSKRQLIELAEAGQFRRDLAWALSTMTIELPPLAERPDDLPLVAQRLLEEVNAAGTKQLSGFSPDALDALAGYDWPGDLQELSDVVAEAHGQAEGPQIQSRDLPARLRLAADAGRYSPKPDDTIVLEQFMAEIERELIERALARARGNKAKAARLLGMTRPRLYRRLVQLGLEEPVIFEEKTDS